MAFDLSSVLLEMVSTTASDLYLAAGAQPKFYLEGVLGDSEAAAGHRLTPDDIEEVANQLMTPYQMEQFQKDKEANLAYMSDEAGRFRVNVYFQRGSIAIVMRRVHSDIPTMRSLGLPIILRDIALAERGIVLVTGATGSGKSTTMASMIDYRNKMRSGHIVTIEDPVEFLYRHQQSIVTQREVGIDTFSFHEALKNSLRQAPQVICIGELRDAETVQFAMHAAETGHLVFATLHSTNAILTVERILNFYPPEQKTQVLQQMALNVKAVVCQRLVPVIGGGRTAAVELMINTPRMSDLITKGDLSALRLGISGENQDGIQNFDKAVYRLYKRGLISMEDALAFAESANDLQLKLRGIGIAAGSSWEDIGDEWENISDDDTPVGAGVKVQAAMSGTSSPKIPPRAPQAGRPAAWNPNQANTPGPASEAEIRYKIFQTPAPTQPAVKGGKTAALPPPPPPPPAAPTPRKPKIPTVPDLDDELDMH